jgi:hypothetical protein
MGALDPIGRRLRKEEDGTEQYEVQGTRVLDLWPNCNGR